MGNIIDISFYASKPANRYSFMEESSGMHILKFNGLILSILLISYGCVVGTRIQGQSYLDQEKYSEGVETFREKLKQNSFDPAANYYMGRYLLALNQPEKAYSYLKEAVALDFKNADYHFWLGVCYHGLNNLKKEQESYHRAIAYNKRHVEAHLYLGHSYLENDQWDKALTAYDRVLDLQGQHAQALYNRALALNQMHRIPEEIAAWKQYLAYYPEGEWAFKAVDHLNVSGNFDYRTFLIGDLRVILEKIRFEPASGFLLENAQPSLDVVGSIMTHNKKIHVKIVGYLTGDKILAKRRADSVKQYIIRKYPKMNSRRLEISGIGKPEKVKAGWKYFDLDDSVNFITIQK
jgi:tetratricopeptide (TPR) repeat protein